MIVIAAVWLGFKYLLSSGLCRTPWTPWIGLLIDLISIYNLLLLIGGNLNNFESISEKKTWKVNITFKNLTLRKLNVLGGSRHKIKNTVQARGKTVWVLCCCIFCKQDLGIFVVHAPYIITLSGKNCLCNSLSNTYYKHFKDIQNSKTRLVCTCINFTSSLK